MQQSAIRIDDVVRQARRPLPRPRDRERAGELRLPPIERNVGYGAASSREVVGHWRKSRSSLVLARAPA